MGMIKKKERFEKKTYVFTSAQKMPCERNVKKLLRLFPERSQLIKSGMGRPNKTLIHGLEKYCETNDAKLNIISINGMNIYDEKLHPFFESRKDVFPSEYVKGNLNENVVFANILVPPQNMDPSTSRERHVRADQTTIFAHSKQRLKSIASGNISHPKLLITTGMCTTPNYDFSNHKGDLAMKEYMLGAVVVEVIDDIYFNVRHVRSLKNGTFIDMGNVFRGNAEIGKAKIEALVLGDIHLGDDDKETMQANYQMIQFFKPQRLFLHDFVNGHSVNPHERKNVIERARAFKKGRLSIEEELKNANKEINKFARYMKGGEVNVVYSNHGFFVDRYLERGEFLKNEPWNVEIALKLSYALLKNENPVEVGIKMMGSVRSNVNFLPLRCDYKVEGWQLASHGHKGTSGTRGSVKSREEADGKSITGHTHAPEILRNTIIVGTSTKLDLPYTDGGASRWVAANAVLYKGGLFQLLPIINGKWRKKERKYKSRRQS